MAPMPIRNRNWVLVAVLVFVALGVGATMFVAQARSHFDEARSRLVVSAQSQARIIEAIAWLDEQSTSDNPRGAFEASIHQIREAQAAFRTYGETGETTLAQRDGDQIIFLLSHRRDGVVPPLPVPISSGNAEPMLRALSGESGVVVGLDYRGVRVLAAFEPVGELDLGVVAKIDMAEVRAPLIRTGVTITVLALMLVVAGVAIFRGFGEPLIRKLAASERQLRLLFEQASDALFLINREGAFVDVNDQACRALGYSRSEMLGLAVPDIDAVYPKTKFDDFMSGMIRSGTSATFESEHQRKDGLTFPVEISTRIINLKGEPHLLSMARDITSRKRVHEELRRQAILVEASTDMMALLDKGYTYLAVNSVYAAAFGRRVDEMVGRTATELFGEDFFEESIQPRAERCYAGEHVSHQEWIKFPASGSRYLDITYSPSRGPDGEITGFVVAGRDITERKRADDAREKLRDRIQQVQKIESLGVLAGGIAHDFNNLLMGVLGNAELVLDELSPSSESYQNVKAIETAALRASTLVRQMLDYSGKGRLVMEPVSLPELVRDALTLLKASALSKTAINFAIDDGVGTLAGDPTQLRQVIINLLTNAAEAIDVQDERGTIDIKVGVRRCDTAYLSGCTPGSECVEGDHVFLEVSDRGIGMDHHTMSQMFDPFFSTKFAGRGLGLAATLGIVHGHNGAIRVTSNPGAGTTVTVLLPVRDLPQALAQAEVASRRGSPRRGTILVVDDEQVVRDVVRRALANAGHDVIVASGGQEALNVFEERSDGIDCVLLDLTMPGMDGVETLAELRRMNDAVPVILCSGYHVGLLESRYGAKGFAGFLQKPFQSEELRAKIDVLLRD